MPPRRLCADGAARPAPLPCVRCAWRERFGLPPPAAVAADTRAVSGADRASDLQRPALSPPNVRCHPHGLVGRSNDSGSFAEQTAVFDQKEIRALIIHPFFSCPLDIKPSNILIELDDAEAAVQSHLERHARPSEESPHLMMSEALAATDPSADSVRVRIDDFGVGKSYLPAANQGMKSVPDWADDLSV